MVLRQRNSLRMIPCMVEVGIGITRETDQEMETEDPADIEAVRPAKEGKPEGRIACTMRTTLLKEERTSEIVREAMKALLIFEAVLVVLTKRTSEVLVDLIPHLREEGIEDRDARKSNIESAMSINVMTGIEEMVVGREREVEMRAKARGRGGLSTLRGLDGEQRSESDHHEGRSLNSERGGVHYRCIKWRPSEGAQRGYKAICTAFHACICEALEKAWKDLCTFDAMF